MISLLYLRTDSMGPLLHFYRVVNLRVLLLRSVVPSGSLLGFLVLLWINFALVLDAHFIYYFVLDP
jgi:hypothetical protein